MLKGKPCEELAVTVNLGMLELSFQFQTMQYDF